MFSPSSTRFSSSRRSDTVRFFLYLILLISNALPRSIAVFASPLLSVWSSNHFGNPPGRIHHGLWTRRGVLPPCTRDPTFHPCIFPLRPGLRCYPYCTRSGRNPLPDRRCRSRHHSLLRHQGLLRFGTSYLFWARRTCFPVVKRVSSRSMLRSTFLSSGAGFVNDGSYGLREFV